MTRPARVIWPPWQSIMSSGLATLRIERGGIGDQLEDGARLIDVAHGVVFEQRRRGVAKVVGVEGGANGERENLAGVHVLHDDGAVVGVLFLHHVIECSLGHELNVFVDGELEILSGVGLVFDGTEDMAARVNRREYASGRAMEARVEFLFKASQAVVVDTDVAQRLRGDLAVGIKALEFFLEVNAFEIEGADPRGDLGRHAARDPGKTAAFIEALGDFGLGGLRVGSVGVDNDASMRATAACLCRRFR